MSPGGRVQKGEQLDDAALRVARDEIGVDVDIRERLGVYEHIYEASDVGDAGGKHYVPVGFVVEADTTMFETDDQHPTCFSPRVPDRRLTGAPRVCQGVSP